MSANNLGQFANAMAAKLQAFVEHLQIATKQRTQEEAEQKWQEEEAERKWVEEEKRRQEEEERWRLKEEERRVVAEVERRAQEVNARQVWMWKEADRLVSMLVSPVGMADKEMVEATTNKEVRKVRKMRKGKTRERKVAVVRKRKRLSEMGPVLKKRARYAETNGESSTKVFDL
jgi:hypothetical protein